MNTSVRIGLTGGIGSGKSTVAQILAHLGATVIDADAIAKSATGPGGAAMQKIENAFGASVLSCNGALDREKMRHLVYADPKAKAVLEGIIHPLVEHEAAHRAKAAEETRSPCIVFDIPLLVETQHWRRTLHRVLVVDCTTDTQIARVTARNGLSTKEIQRVLAAQATRHARLNAADMVLFNDGITISQLTDEVKELSSQFGL